MPRKTKRRIPVTFSTSFHSDCPCDLCQAARDAQLMDTLSRMELALRVLLLEAWVLEARIAHPELPELSG